VLAGVAVAVDEFELITLKDGDEIVGGHVAG